MTSARGRRRTTMLLAAVAVACSAALTPAGAQATTRFQSPSGNIACALGTFGARCDIRAKTWSVPRPKGCRLDWGQGLTVTRRGSRGRVVCAGDTVLGAGRKLGYGRKLSSAGTTCRSRTSGVTCVNPRGHGFRIARASYRLF